MALDLKQFTMARVGMARKGHSLATAELLRFELDHAKAKDAVWAVLDPASVPSAKLYLHSQAANRREYLARPDLGRALRSSTSLSPGQYDLSIAVADGLSALAVNRHAQTLLDQLLPLLDTWRLSPITLVHQGRVAIADEIASRLNAKLSLILIGERPGLSSPDSLGAYLTHNPQPGRTDAERNCVSNIRPDGLPPQAAALLLHRLLEASRAQQISGIGLQGDAALLPSG